MMRYFSLLLVPMLAFGLNSFGEGARPGSDAPGEHRGATEHTDGKNRRPPPKRKPPTSPKPPVKPPAKPEPTKPEPTKPPTRPEPKKPPTRPEPTKPPTRPEPKKPPTRPEPTKPPTRPEPTKPPTRPEPTKPPTRPEPTKPPTRPEPTKPPTRPEPTKPPTRPEPTKPPTRPEPTKPPTRPEPKKPPTRPGDGHRPPSDPTPHRPPRHGDDRNTPPDEARPSPITRHGNQGEPAHYERVSEARGRARHVMHQDRRVRHVVSGHASRYDRDYRPIVHRRYESCQEHYYRWGTYYRPWYRYGFYGGWYWQLRPIYRVDAYYYNPIVFWLYVDEWDEYYYRTWYGAEYDRYPHLHRVFHRPGVFFPTQAMIDLSLGTSVLSFYQQGNFHYGLIDLVNKLELQLAEPLDYSPQLGRNDVVVTHYQMLDGAVVLDGFVDADGRQFPFKAFLDLNDVSLNRLFVPRFGDEEPMENELYVLRSMNERIERLGGAIEYSNDGDVPAAPDQQ